MSIDIYSDLSAPIFQSVTQQSDKDINDNFTWTETIIVIIGTAILFISWIVSKYIIDQQIIQAQVMAHKCETASYTQRF